MKSTPEGLDAQLLAHARATEGFMDDTEGVALGQIARRAALSGLGPLLEIGAYRGRSTLYLASGLKAAQLAGAPPRSVLYSLDHHRGSEEMQAGWPHHDEGLVDPSCNKMDSLPHWRRSINNAGADELVVALVGLSSLIATNWATALSLVFVDGGHGEQNAWDDYELWSTQVAEGGLLAFHDVFENPEDGGRPPYECYRAACSSGVFSELEEMGVKSLRVLQRTMP